MRAPLVFLQHHGRRSGATLVELLVTCSLVALVGGLAFLSLHTGVHLFGKNLAVNVPYQSSRAAFDLLQRDLHGSLAEPRLIDSTLADVPGAGPAAGVALRAHVGGPGVVAADATAAASTLEVWQIPGFAPRPGDLLSLPAFRIERTITAVVTAGPKWTLTLDAPLATALAGTGTADYAAFFSRRIGYATVGGALLRYADLSQPGTFRVLSRGVTNPTPFSFPLLGGQPDRRYLTTALTVREASTSARQWQGVDSNLNFTLAFRATAPLTAQ